MSDSFLDKYVKRAAAPPPSPVHDGEVIELEGQNPHAHASPDSPGTSSLSALGDTAESATDFGCFGWLRGVRERALMLELRKKSGHVMALGYAWIERMEFDPAVGIILYAPGQQIRINGTALNIETKPSICLFDGLVRHRVPWIRESDQNESMRADQSPHSLVTLIERITWDG